MLKMLFEVQEKSNIAKIIFFVTEKSFRISIKEGQRQG